jgi:hypothetical protein
MLHALTDLSRSMQLLHDTRRLIERITTGLPQSRALIMLGKGRAAARHEQQQIDRQIILTQTHLSRIDAQDLREKAAATRWLTRYLCDQQSALRQDALRHYARRGNSVSLL